MIDKINEILERKKQLEDELASPEVNNSPKLMEKLGREYRSLNKHIPTYSNYLDMMKTLEDNRELAETETDPELIAMAKDEIAAVEKELPEIEEAVRYMLVPKDPNDAKNAIVEIRAGTGGLEAGIFGADLFRMYMHFIEKKKWEIKVLSSNYGEMGALKEVIFEVNGEDAYGTLKFESGVHRVQRVPETEAQGRVHTSAASVAVLPETDDIELNIGPDDLRIDVFRAGGKGGQHVNKTESAVRIVHLPTGITVQCQDEKSQLKNKEQAMKILMSRIMDAKVAEKHDTEAAYKKSLVGSGDRSEKIRTYNFPQNRLTDHRINLTLYKLDAVMNGDLQEIVDALSRAELNESLKVEDK
jgi:peptide chain release factor 1